MDEIKLIESSNGHFYHTPIGILPGVTTIMRAIPNPYLEAWKNRTPDWRAISARAAEIGTKTHRIIECYLKDEPVDALYCAEIEKPFSAFQEWQCSSGFELVDSERMIWSAQRYAGTVDLIGYLNGELHVIDLKTSKAVYSDYLLQLAAYRTGYEERTGKNIERMGILRLDKATGKFEWKEYGDGEYRAALDEFLLICESWHRSNGGVHV